MQLLASDAGDCLKDMTVLVIVFGVCLHIPAGMGAAKNKNWPSDANTRPADRPL